MSQTPPPSPTPSSPSPAQPAKSGNKVLIVILCVLGGLFLLIGGCVATCVYYGGKKIKELSEQAEKNPAYATVSILASLHPDVEIVSKDEATGKITLRNKKNGEQVTLDTTQYTADNIGDALEKFAKGAQIAAQKAANATQAASESAEVSPEDSAALKAKIARFPAYVAVYPDAATDEATYESAGGVQSGTYLAHTHDDPAAILDFYEKKLKGAGFSITNKSEQDNTGVLAALASSPTRSVTLSINPGDEGISNIELSFQQLAN